MRLIELDASEWTRQDQFYRALLGELGAPSWHGHNLDALNDSIFDGQINRIEPPFHVIITHTDKLDSRMRDFLKAASLLFFDGRAETGLDAYLDFHPPL